MQMRMMKAKERNNRYIEDFIEKYEERKCIEVMEI